MLLSTEPVFPFALLCRWGVTDVHLNRQQAGLELVAPKQIPKLEGHLCFPRGTLLISCSSLVILGALKPGGYDLCTCSLPVHSANTRWEEPAVQGGHRALLVSLSLGVILSVSAEPHLYCSQAGQIYPQVNSPALLAYLGRALPSLEFGSFSSPSFHVGLDVHGL